MSASRTPSASRFVPLVLLAAYLPAAAEAPVGFIWHYPFVDAGTDLVAGSGVTMMMARAPWAVIEPEEGRFEFEALERQLSIAREGGFVLALILECNPFCAPPWLREQVAEAGEITRGTGGHPSGIPSTQSPVFLDAQEQFLLALAEFLARSDPQHTIAWYVPGIEWWFPPEYRYAAAEIAEFRQWLAARYGSPEALAAAWGREPTEFSLVQPPFIDGMDLWNAEGMERRAYLLSQPFAGSGLAAAARDWHRYWSELAASEVDALARRTARVDPSRPRVSFLTLTWAHLAEWDYAQWSAVDPALTARTANYLDIIGMQLPVAGGDTQRITGGLDLARKYGKPLWVLDLLDFADGVKAGPAVMERATHAAVQHGASGLVYCCWSGAEDFNFHPDWPLDEIRGMITSGRRALELVDGLRPAPRAAIVDPFLPATPGVGSTTRASAPNRVDSFIGWYRLLEYGSHTVDVVTLDEVADGALDSERYDWVLAPDCAAIGRQALEELRRYSEAGGTLISGGRFADLDDAGRPTPPTARSISGMVPLPDYGRRAVPRTWRRGDAGDTPPMTMWDPPSSGVVEQALRQLEGALADAGLEPPLSVIGAPPEVRGVRLEGPSGPAAYLVNHGHQPAQGGRLVLREGPARSYEAYADLTPVSVSWRRRGGAIEFDLPAFRTSFILRPTP